MPSEDRRIIFTFEEVYKAVYGLCVQKNLAKPPAGIIVAIERDEQDDGAMVLYLKNDLEREGARKAQYSRDFLAAALMLYCRGCGIPIPRIARKSVLSEENSLILRVEVAG